MGLQKNVASQVITYCLVNATSGAALTGATVTTKVTLDGTQSSSAGTTTELGTGQYKYVPTQGETNGTSVGFGFTATNAVPVNIHCFTIGQDPTQATLKSDLTTIKGQAVTCAAPVTVLASVGTAATSTAQTGDCYARLGAPAGGVSISADIAGVQSDTDNIQTRLPAALTANGNIKSSLLEILTSTLSETGTGYLSAAFKKFLDVVTPVFTCVSINQSGDCYTRIGGPAGGVSISADLAAVKVDTAAIKAKTDSLTFTSGKVDANVSTIVAGAITAASIATGAIDADALASDAVDEIWAKACTEPTGVVGANPAAIDALAWISFLSRNKLTQDASEQKAYADNGSTVVATSSVTDNGTIFTRNKYS